ncbi:hypothetical protein Psch_04031 [Pelotomaculum schinkii]|uniref:HD-associated domain-containing protein n=1 Tax=Pelotomaculum schinkii TaxID=78350 RepID=A0A4Y7R5T5_9FIRM|nr:hypothetical protein [Pelotomaculum schinkii]TEB04305.1 hypothetical protein Psch_04031 [Pelotomaculum schinkii]
MTNCCRESINNNMLKMILARQCRAKIPPINHTAHRPTHMAAPDSTCTTLGRRSQRAKKRSAQAGICSCEEYYCGVQYGKYDLHRLLDTFCICFSNGDPSREWQLGIESDGVHAVEEFVFARYWMFLQVYFHKTRRIYDYYLVNFLKLALDRERRQSYPIDLKEYLSWNDQKVLQLIEKYSINGSNIWAHNLNRRQHIKEAFVSTPHPEENEDERKDELGRIAFVISEARKKFPVDKEPDRYYIDQSKTSSSKYLIEIPKFITETQEDEDNKLFAVPVFDKLTKKIKSIQDFSNTSEEFIR